MSLTFRGGPGWEGRVAASVRTQLSGVLGRLVGDE
jgi:hypothetical protein